MASDTPNRNTPGEKPGRNDRRIDEEAGSVGPAIFSGHCSASFSAEMADKVRLLHERFDRDGDGLLNYEELRSLQLVTSGADMTPDVYSMVCRALDCDPGKGVMVGALKLTYAAEGTDIDADYSKVFQMPKNTSEKVGKPTDEDDVIEVGEGGVDISPS